MEDIAASFAPDVDGAVTSDVVNEFLSTEVMCRPGLHDRRRKLAEAQEMCDDVKRSVCVKIEEKTPRPLHERIMALRDTDKELYDYIWTLRSLKYGIWCAQCEQAKNIGGRDPEDARNDVEAEARGETPGTHAVKKHIPLSKDNRIHAALMPPAAQERTLALHGPGSIPCMTQKQLDAMPKSLQKHAIVAAEKSGKTAYREAQSVYPPVDAAPVKAASVKAASVKAASVKAASVKAAPPASASLPQDVLDKLPQQVAALTALRDQIGGQLSQVDKFIASLAKYAGDGDDAGDDANGKPASAAANPEQTKNSSVGSSRTANSHTTTSYTIGDGEDVLDGPDLADIIGNTLDEYDDSEYTF